LTITDRYSVTSSAESTRQDSDIARRVPFPLRTDEVIREAILGAIRVVLSDRPDFRVEWESLSITPIDGKPGTGRCAVCNCWVYDVENVTSLTPTMINRGAIVNEQYLCDEHLPEHHPVAF